MKTFLFFSTSFVFLTEGTLFFFNKDIFVQILDYLFPIPQNKSPDFYNKWVEECGGLEKVFKRYGNRLPKEFFELFDTVEDCVLSLSFMYTKKRSFVYLCERYFALISSEKKYASDMIVTICHFYSKEYRADPRVAQQIEMITKDALLKIITREGTNLWYLICLNTKSSPLTLWAQTLESKHSTI